MPDPQGASLTAAAKRFNLPQYLTREPVILALLSALAVVSFAAVSALSSIYHTQQKSLGTEWFARGSKDLQDRHFERASEEFHTALLYSRDNDSYQLNLALALLGQKRTEEASAYLVSLWERQPDNGFVNLELARIAAQKGETEEALRYYHNAIYATWPGDQPTGRQQTRLELIRYLLKMNEKLQAQSELIALAANIGDDPARRAQLGQLFLDAQDYKDALAAYRLSFKASRHDPAVWAGAGLAAFELRLYADAERYLRAALAAGSRDPDVSLKLKLAELVLQMDPFRRQVSLAGRSRIVIEAFAAAGQRLQSCAPPGPVPTAQQNLYDRWQEMKPRITARELRRNPDLTESAMELVFNIERQTSAACAPNPTDGALLLIAKLHEGN